LLKKRQSGARFGTLILHPSNPSIQGSRLHHSRAIGSIWVMTVTFYLISFKVESERWSICKKCVLAIFTYSTDECWTNLLHGDHRFKWILQYELVEKNARKCYQGATPTDGKWKSKKMGIGTRVRYMSTNKLSFIGNFACLLHTIFSIPILRDITSRRSYYIYELKQQLEKANWVRHRPNAKNQTRPYPPLPCEVCVLALSNATMKWKPS
jgi:hypothetical protein